MNVSLLELKRAEKELCAVTSARLEQEYRIMEKEEEIKRLKDAIEVQLKKEKELSDKLKSLQSLK